jgi:hypothetical protein
MHTSEQPIPDPRDGSLSLFLRWVEQKPRECPNCHYALRGLTRPRCPECGVELVLSVRPADPRSRAHLLGLIGLATGLGFAGTLLLLMAVFSAFGIDGPSSERFYAFCVGGSATFGAAMFFWRRRRRDFRQLSAGTRWRLALLAWALSLAYVVFFAWAVDLR